MNYILSRTFHSREDSSSSLRKCCLANDSTFFLNFAIHVYITVALPSLIETEHVFTSSIDAFFVLLYGIVGFIYNFFKLFFFIRLSIAFFFNL